MTPKTNKRNNEANFIIPKEFPSVTGLLHPKCGREFLFLYISICPFSLSSSNMCAKNFLYVEPFFTAYEVVYIGNGHIHIMSS